MTEVVRARCCIVGGGPAGMMLGFLLARAGIEVLVLEKHGDFLRDFRGDTVHPSTLEVFYELGFLDELLELPHQKAYEFQLQADGAVLTVANLRKLATRCPFIAFMPQWDFLSFLARKARSYPSFELRMQAEVTGLLEGAGGVEGVRAKMPAGDLEVRATLVVACDGRHSVVRERAGFAVRELGAPMDVLWFRISRRPGDPEQAMARVTRGRFFVLINRTGHWQCGYVIPKGAADDIKARGLDRFLGSVAQLAPFLAGRVSEIRNWDDVPLLSVRVDRLRRWYRPGLLCIGDAAHAMSPVAGVGINLAIQDAVATANLLAAPLGEGEVSPRSAMIGAHASSGNGKEGAPHDCRRRSLSAALAAGPRSPSRSTRRRRSRGAHNVLIVSFPVRPRLERPLGRAPGRSRSSSGASGPRGSL